MRLSEKELVSRAAQGDLEAIHTLVYDTYRESLERVIRKQVYGCDTNRVEEWLSDFQMHLIEPNKDGHPRCRNLSMDAHPRTYLGTALTNFIRDRFTPAGSDVSYDDPDRPLPPAPPAGGEDPAESRERLERRELEIKVLIKALEALDGLNPLDRYVLLTFLISERFRGERPLKIREALAEQLHMNPSTLYKKYADNLRRLRVISAELLNKLSK